MGSGGLIVMDEDTCMVDVARFFLDFMQDESCGKCAPCRVGTRRMLEILNRICEGKGEEGDIEKLMDLGRKIKDTALCGLGQTAPNPVLSTIRHFRDEYVAHIRDKRCPAGVCPALVRAPCQNACPAGVFVPGFVSLVGEKRYAEALRLHRERNPFVSVCARVCFHTCEDKCRRETLDEPLSIRGIKRFMVEQEVTVQLPEVRDNQENAKRKIAIVGAGPAGLSCAYFLARMGYRPKVFEAEARPGGMLVQAIPAYRLPREELAREVRMIERLGVEIETGMRLGRDFTLKGLRDEGYEAVFLGVGAPEGLKLGVPGEEAEGVSDAIRFLREYNIRGSAPVGRKVAIVGGGNAAIDAARTAVRLGAKSVTVIYRRTRAEMPAYAEEIEEAENEGVKLDTLVAPVEILTKGGKAVGVKCRRMALGDFDRSGRRRPVASREEEFVVEADQVLTAIGQSLNAKELMDGMPIKLNASHFIEADPVTCRTSVEWIFAGGDAVLGAELGGTRGGHRGEGRRGDGQAPDRRGACVLARGRTSGHRVRPGGRAGGVYAREDAADPAWRSASTTSPKWSCRSPKAWHCAKRSAACVVITESKNRGGETGMPTITIDNTPVEAAEGATILEAARKAGVEIPTLCYLENVQAIGACRVCLVEVEGAKTLVASCVMPATAGMKVHTNSKRVREARRMVVELLLSDHDGDCQTCNRSDNCELQSLARELGIKNGDVSGGEEQASERHEHAGAGAGHVEVRSVPEVCDGVRADAGRGGAVSAASGVQVGGGPGVQQRVERRGVRAVRAVRGGVSGGRDQRARPD